MPKPWCVRSLGLVVCGLAANASCSLEEPVAERGGARLGAHEWDEGGGDDTTEDQCFPTQYRCEDGEEALRTMECGGMGGNFYCFDNSGTGKSETERQCRAAGGQMSCDHFGWGNLCWCCGGRRDPPGCRCDSECNDNMHCNQTTRRCEYDQEGGEGEGGEGEGGGGGGEPGCEPWDTCCDDPDPCCGVDCWSTNDPYCCGDEGACDPWECSAEGMDCFCNAWNQCECPTEAGCDPRACADQGDGCFCNSLDECECTDVVILCDFDADCSAGEACVDGYCLESR